MIIIYNNIIKFYTGGVKSPSRKKTLFDNYCSPVECPLKDIPQGIFYYCVI